MLWREGLGLSFVVAAMLYAPFVRWNAHAPLDHASCSRSRSATQRNRCAAAARVSRRQCAARYSPGLWIAALLVLVRPRNALVAWTAIPLAALLIVLNLHERIELHWFFGPYVSLCVGMGVAFEALSHRARVLWATAGAVPAGVLIPFLFLAAAFPGQLYEQFRATGSTLRNSGPFEIFTYWPLAQDVRRMADANDAVVVTDGYGFSSQMDFEAGIPPVVDRLRSPRAGVAQLVRRGDAPAAHPVRRQGAARAASRRTRRTTAGDPTSTGGSQRRAGACGPVRRSEYIVHRPDGALGPGAHVFPDVVRRPAPQRDPLSALGRRERRRHDDGKVLIDYIPLTATAAKRTTTSELRTLACERMRRLGYPFVATEFTPSRSGCRFDVIGLGRYTRQVRIYEVKSSRADFLADGKWPSYLPYCTHFAFVAPAGAIQRWELDRDVGLIEYGHPAFERMIANRRYGFLIRPEDALRASRPARRLRDAVADEEWLALLETIAFGQPLPAGETTFTDGAGI